MALQDIFIHNMRKYRKSACLTHEKLAEFCDSDPRYISQIETGRRFPSITYIEKIALALNIAPHLLFQDDAALQANFSPLQKDAVTRALIDGVTEKIRGIVDVYL